MESADADNIRLFWDYKSVNPKAQLEARKNFQILNCASCENFM